jgi:hypothetical protein
MKSQNSNINKASEPSISDDLSLRHLQAELKRIDAMIRREIYRWQLAGQEPSDTFRGLYVSDQQANAMMDRPIFMNWGYTGRSQPDTFQLFDEAIRQAGLDVKAIVNTARAQGHRLRLKHLIDIFGLTDFEKDIVLICLAPSLDLRYESIYGYLQDNITIKLPSVNLTLDLLCEPGTKRLNRYTHFRDDAPLFRHQILRYTPENGGHIPLLRKTLTLDKTIFTWLIEKYQPDLEISAHTHYYGRPEKPNNVLCPDDLKSQLDQAIHGSAILVFSGPDLVRQDTAAGYISANQGRSLFYVNLSAFVDEGNSPLEVIKIIFRDSQLLNAIPYITGWDACISDHRAPSDLFKQLCSYPDLAIISGTKSWQPGGSHRERIFHWLDFQIPTFSERLTIWDHYAEKVYPAHGLDLISLAGQFQLTTGQIRDAVASARDIATQDGRELKGEDLFIAARGHSNPNLAGLARKLTPRYGWADIVLPDDQVNILREIVATVRCRPTVLDDWGVGKKLASSRGVTALFSGPPGTGKTMAAEIIAAELNLDLYKIDLSTVVSKYIGETEKNLERIFKEAETSNAILFFDEADALFGKRSEVRDSHDRYANIEISFLLQRMEAYNGVTILATNLRANLDEAFTRRLQFAVDFPFPEKNDRLEIWKTLFPPGIPQNKDLDFDFMAEKFKLAGGNIRNIIINAAYLAADDGQFVTMEHLLHGARRELQKMGRLIGEEYLSAE